MRKHQFRPASVDVLEDRLVLSTVVHPAIVHAESAVVNPKFLNLTGRTEHQIFSGLKTAFERFATTYLAKTATVATQTVAFHSLDGDLLSISRKIPFGGQDAYPGLESATTGAGYTDRFYGPVPSLEFVIANPTPGVSTRNRATVEAYEYVADQMIVRDIEAGVSDGQIKLVRGAYDPYIAP